jgi:hypothetical protein
MGPLRRKTVARAAAGPSECGMTVWILCFFALGAGFGLATWRHRHLFSEGPSRPARAEDRTLLDGRIAWVVLCSALWPLMALTGLVSWWKLARRARVHRNRQE